MSAMRKVGVYLGLLEDTGHYDDYSDGEHTTHVDRAQYDRSQYDRGQYDEPAERQPRRQRAEQRHGAPAPKASVSKLADRRPTAVPSRSLDLSRITTLHPTTYNDARTVGDNFRDGVPVIMNLSDMRDEDAKRLVDFAAGLVFAVQGTLERVTSKVFLVSPPHVAVSAVVADDHADDAIFAE